MKSRIFLTLIACGAFALAASGGARPAPADGAKGVDSAQIIDFAWLAGGWRARQWGGELEERWLAPAGGTMLGVSRLVRDGATPFYEFMRLEAGDGGATLTVYVQGGAGTDFELTRMGEREAVFTNPGNDPSEIFYRAEPGGGLFAHIRGVRNGEEYTEPFRFERAE